MSRIPKAQLRAQLAQHPRSNHPQACFDIQKKEPALSVDLIKLARKSGQLNLTGRGMIDVPEQVWNIHSLSEDERRTMSLSLDQSDGDRWWDQADLTRLYLSSNKLSSLSPDIEKLHALTILELNDNALTSLPDAIGSLRQLTKLNIRQALRRYTLGGARAGGGSVQRFLF